MNEYLTIISTIIFLISFVPMENLHVFLILYRKGYHISIYVQLFIGSLLLFSYFIDHIENLHVFLIYEYEKEYYISINI